jgi:hypothetical protein
MFTTIKIGYIPSNSIHYSEAQEDFFFEFDGAINWLCCKKDWSISIIYDQVFRQMYYNYDCKIILSHYFYPFQDPLSLKKGYEYYQYRWKGFF